MKIQVKKQKNNTLKFRSLIKLQFYSQTFGINKNISVEKEKQVLCKIEDITNSWQTNLNFDNEKIILQTTFYRSKWENLYSRMEYKNKIFKRLEINYQDNLVIIKWGLTNG